jgi:predicted short-subunit dehydrogenase-like oxidoreductase (DUF2520 family)
MRVGIIGGGRAAWTFAQLFRRLQWPISGVALPAGSTSRLPELLATTRQSAGELAAHCDLMLLAVPDRVIREVAHEVGDRDGLTLFHVSGCLDSSILPTRRRFSLHPLRALVDVGATVELGETLFVFEGSSDCEGLARELTAAGGAHFERIAPEAKTLYHSAAVFASNYIAAVCSVAEQLFRDAGITAEGRGAIAALAASAVDNWRGGAADRRYTGPIVRGDVECVSAHLEALSTHPSLRDLYARLGAILAADLTSSAQREEIKELFRNATAR